MTFDQLFINRKLKDIEGYVGEVKNLLSFSNKEILEDSIKMHSAERLVQLIVDAMVDVNQHIIKEKRLKEFEDFQSAFYVLAQNKILPEDFANKVAPVVAVRNRIVHGYESLDKKLFIKNLRKNYSDFNDYVKFIKAYSRKLC